MALQRKRLTARAVATLTDPGRHADGGNLYLNVTSTGARSWIFLYRRAGRQREMGLGSALDVTLAAARDLAEAARRELREGRDPLASKQKPVAVQTFGEAADAYVEAMRPQWKSEKHAEQWAMTLRDYAAPIRAKPVRGDRDSRRAGRAAADLGLEIRDSLPAARPHRERAGCREGQGQRTGDNPARWRGHLDQLLPKRAKLSRGHHEAMPIDALPAFMARCRAREGMSACALKFTILTAARTGEAIGAPWAEFDLDKGVWTVPAERMKAGREHRVPLSIGCAGRREARSARLGRGTSSFPARSRQAAVQHGDGQGVAARKARRHGARLPVDVPGLGDRAHRLPARALRDGAGPHHREQGRGGLPPGRHDGEAPRVDGGLGSVLRGVCGADDGRF